MGGRGRGSHQLGSHRHHQPAQHHRGFCPAWPTDAHKLQDLDWDTKEDVEEGGGGGEDKAVPGGRGRGILKLMGTGGVESAVKLGVGQEE